MRWKAASALALAGLFVLGNGMAVCAEEAAEITEEPAGYHVYDVQENEASDSWYGIARGAYLKAGIAKLKEGSKPSIAICTGTTLAHVDCDRMYVRVYLDESDNGRDGWWTRDYWTGEDFNTSMVHVTSDLFTVTKGKYYSAKGVHSATKALPTGEKKTETTTTCTDALLFTW